MRRFIFALILATAATAPAVAQSIPEERRAEREKARAERADRASARTERDERVDQRRAQVRERGAFRQVDRGDVVQRAPRAAPRFVRVRPTIEQRRETGDGVANWRREQRDQARQPRGVRPDRVTDRTARPRFARTTDSRDHVRGTRGTQSRGVSPQWRSTWHNDRRHNWREHRRRNGSLFRLGIYFDPFGRSYQRYNRGWHLRPNYYHSSFWLNDPSMFRLPYAPHPYKWIRYWDDALLVDTYTGQVVDVVHDFFW